MFIGLVFLMAGIGWNAEGSKEG